MMIKINNNILRTVVLILCGALVYVYVGLGLLRLAPTITGWCSGFSQTQSTLPPPEVHNVYVHFKPVCFMY